MLFMSCVCHAFASVNCCLMESADLLALVCDVYCDFFLLSRLVSWVRCGIVRPVKRDWAVLSKDTPVDISI